MHENRSDDRHQLQELRPLLDRHSDDEIKTAIIAEDFSQLFHLPADARQRIAGCPDLWTDIWWYVEIRSKQDLDDFPCVHIAYAMSPNAKGVISRSHGVFAININEERTQGLVFSHCPWCAKPLNVSATRNAIE
jgi:hypothetical protein